MLSLSACASEPNRSLSAVASLAFFSRSACASEPNRSLSAVAALASLSRCSEPCLCLVSILFRVASCSEAIIPFVSLCLVSISPCVSLCLVSLSSAALPCDNVNKSCRSSTAFFTTSTLFVSDDKTPFVPGLPNKVLMLSIFCVISSLELPISTLLLSANSLIASICFVILACSVLLKFATFKF